MIHRIDASGEAHRVGEGEDLVAQVGQALSGAVGGHDQLRIVDRLTIDLRRQQQFHAKLFVANHIGVGADEGKLDLVLLHHVIQFGVGAALHQIDGAP
jgi:hypothetical protein